MGVPPGSMNNRGYWQWLPILSIQRPLMTRPESQKDETYHNQVARYYLSQQIGEWINYYRQNDYSNTEYGIDNRWGEPDDIKMFLGDGALQTSRVPFKVPIMSAMLTRLVGAVDNISIEAKAEPVTDYFVETRKEAFLNKVRAHSQFLASAPNLAPAYAGMGITADEDESTEHAGRSYQDKIIKGGTALMNSMANRSKLKDTKRTVAARMALSGAAAAHSFIQGGNLEWEFCEPQEIGWDTTAIEPDLSDGNFVYTCPLMSVSGIAERWNPKRDMIVALDTWSAQSFSNTIQGTYGGWPQSRPRVFTMYWKDMKQVERGFVIDESGEMDFCIINQNDPDTGKPKYTDKDLVDPPVNMYTLAWEDFERKAKKIKRYVEVVRFCSFIPWEYLPGCYTKGQKYDPSRNFIDNGLPELGLNGDMVFDWGEYPLQEADPDNEYSVKFPLKISTWRYLKGHVVAPMNVAIDSQRWINQITSDIHWRMSKAGGVLTVVSKEAVAGSALDEQEVELKAKEGGVIFVESGSLGVQNIIKDHDTSPGTGVYNLMNMLPTVKGFAESSMGIYEGNYGAPQGEDQLVGTMQLQLQQAGVQQQPFYAAVAHLYKQIAQHDIQAGKQFYCRRPWKLVQMVGQESADALTATPDAMVEQFRVKVDLVPDGAQQRISIDQALIPSLIQLGELDPMTAAMLQSQRANTDDVYAAARDYTAQAAKAQQQAAQQQQQQMQQQQMGMRQQQLEEQQDQLHQQQVGAQLEQEKLDVKKNAPVVTALADHLKPQEDPSTVTA